MMRLIDADNLFRDKVFLVSNSDSLEAIKKILTIIDEAPTIDAEPVRHGKWIWDDEGFHCSECWYHAQGNTLDCLDGTFRFCPVCGARNEPIKSGTDLNDITEWGEYEVNDGNDKNET